MELGRWSIEQITRISDRYRNFKEFLADVLEGDRSLVEGEAQKVPERSFTPRSDIESLKGEHGVKGGRQRVFEGKHDVKNTVKNSFTKLAPFFEAGFLLEIPSGRDASSTDLKLDSMFLFGKVFDPARNEAPTVKIPMPEFSSERVYQGRTSTILRVFRLDGLRGLNDARAFAFKPCSRQVVVLICSRPHPWQVTAIEKAYSYLMPSQT